MLAHGAEDPAAGHQQRFVSLPRQRRRRIVYGIGAIKGVGEGPIEAIIEARNSGEQGYFKDLFDLCARSDIKKLNRRILEKLIMSGAFDRLGPHRAALMNSLGDALKAADQHAKAEAIGG